MTALAPAPGIWPTPTVPSACPAAVSRRILFIEPNDDGTVGGSHQVLYDLARGLDGTGYQPVVLFNQQNSFVARLRASGIEVHVFDGPWTRERTVIRTGNRIRQAAMLLEAIARRARFLRRHDIALVHVNGTPQTAQDDWLPAARLTRTPIIATCAGNLSFDVASRLELRLMRAFDRVLPVSEHVAAQARRFGYDASRITMIHPGIDLDALRARLSRDPATVRRELVVDAETMLVSMVGNLRRWKGQHVAIEALARMAPSDRMRVKLIFAGSASPADRGYEEELHQLVARHSLQRQVTFLGRRDDAAEIMAASDVVLHASIDPEPFGLVLLEGMALGRAVVASANGGPAEILDDASGLRYPPGDADSLADHLRILLADPTLRRSMGEAGRRRAEQFAIGRTVRAAVAVYGEVLDAT